MHTPPDLVGHALCLAGPEAKEHMDDYVDVPGPEGQTAELVSILVDNCGCGCTFGDHQLTSCSRDCTAVRMLHDRRFVLGLGFARTLRQQLIEQEWRREQSPAPLPMPLLGHR